MSEGPRWLDQADILVLHDYVIARTGGASGVRDLGLLASALDRPVNRHGYEGVTDLAVLAAAYAVGVAKNHPFVDGNKRTAFLALGLFLELNGDRLTAPDADATTTMLAVAAGEMDEPTLADWIRANSGAA